jgi:two-component system, chemotaxis family, protein-glutamate methylesterase/glutaminase
MKKSIIVMGASAGGITALGQVLRALPEDLQAAVLVVQHTAQGPGKLAEVLGRGASLPVTHPRDEEKLRMGRVYVAPPDLHMLLEKEKIRLFRGPRENRHRPAVDPLFKSAALHHGVRVIGVVLTGALDDGASGLATIKQHGGTAVVQSPESAEFRGMPDSALRHVKADHVVNLTDMPGVLVKLTQANVKSKGRKRGSEGVEVEAAEGKTASTVTMDGIGSRSALICPTCKGALWEMDEGSLLRFRCHIGHGFTADDLLTDQGQEVEMALSHALRALEDRANLAKRLAARSRERQQLHNQALYEAEMADARRHAEMVRKTLLSLRPNDALG